MHRIVVAGRSLATLCACNPLLLIPCQTIRNGTSPVTLVCHQVEGAHAVPSVVVNVAVGTHLVCRATAIVGHHVLFAIFIDAPVVAPCNRVFLFIRSTPATTRSG